MIKFYDVPTAAASSLQGDLQSNLEHSPSERCMAAVVTPAQHAANMALPGVTACGINEHVALVPLDPMGASTDRTELRSELRGTDSLSRIKAK